MGYRLKRIAFIYLISYLAVAAVGFGLFPTLTLKLFLSNGDYGVILPRLLGAMMGVLSFLLFMIYRQGDSPKYSPFTMMARAPLVLFIFYLYYASRDPMFLIINGIILVGLITTAVGTALERSASEPDSPASTPARDPVRHVCICVDGSPVSSWTLPHGLAMARAFGASLSVVRVLELPRAEGIQASAYALERETRRSDARRDLDRICEAHQSPNLPIDTALLEGRVTEEIRQWVSHNDADLAVLCSHGAGGWTKNGLASTAERLVRRLSVPTLLIPASILDELPKKEVTYARILVPLDASPQAEHALPLAVRLAREHGSELILIHVVPVPELIKREPLNDEERELEQRLIDRNTRVAKRYLGRLCDQLSQEGVRVRTVLTHDDVQFELMRTIEREHPDLIVLSGHGRGGRTPLRLGSVASFLVEHATAPTLIVRPRGNPASHSHDGETP